MLLKFKRNKLLIAWKCAVFINTKTVLVCMFLLSKRNKMSFGNHIFDWSVLIQI